MATRIVSALVLFGIVATGCTARQDTTQPAEQASARTGAQLWSDNCARCHNARPPQSYSDAQWEAVVHHMRLRADLTGQEQRKVTEFLQAAH